MYSKSLFTRQSNVSRTVIDPLGVVGMGVGGGFLSADTIKALKAVQEYYTMNLANKTYDKVPTDYTKFLHLFYTIRASYNKAGSHNMRLLLKITEEGLVGAMNSYGLNYTVVETKLQNTMLQNTIEDILSGKNVKNAFGSNTGQLTIKKTFTLAPLFSYYILLYGMPEAGVGFDQNKLSILLSIFEKNGMNPYK
jgi:hypothetical protein